MQEITRKEFIDFLESCNKNEMRIKVDGYIKTYLILKNYNLEIINDELKLQEKDSEKYFIFNFNTIRHMCKENNEIIFYIDDEVDTRIEISYQ